MTIPGPPGHPNTAVTSVQGITGATPVTVALAATGSGFVFDSNGNLAITGGVTPATGGSVVDVAAEASLAAIQGVSGTPSTGAWSGSGDGTLVGVLKAIYAKVAGTLTVGLPTGAATAAKQPALGTAGSPSTDVITVQGAASGTGLRVVTAGATPADFSSAGLAAPIGGMVLLNTIPPTATRAAVEVQNQSAAMIQLILDDGAVGAGTISSILLTGSAASTQGGGWSSDAFKGRVRIYGASGAQVAAYQV